MKKYIAVTSLALLLGMSTNVMAQTVDTTTPAPSRVNQIDQRLDNQQKRIESGVASGAITAKQEAVDVKKDAKVATELSKDEAKHGGTITKAEQKKMNRQLSHNSKRIHHQKVKAVVTAPVTPVTTPAQ